MADNRLLLATLPLVAATMARKQAAQEPDPEERWWCDFRAAAPAPVWQYVLDLNAEAAADPTCQIDSDNWLDDRHPAFDDVLEGLHHAVRTSAPDRLAYVQGWVVKIAEWRLGYAFARERAAGVSATVYNDAVRAEAAERLLGWTVADFHGAWLEPERFADRWRVAGTTDTDILARAGLFGAELSLLAAEGGTDAPNAD